MVIELIETSEINPELTVQLSMADSYVIVNFYSNQHCTVLVEYSDSTDSTKSVFTVHRNKEVKAVEAALRIVSNFDGNGSEEDYKLAESIMPAVAEARWIP